MKEDIMKPSTDNRPIQSAVPLTPTQQLSFLKQAGYKEHVVRKGRGYYCEKHSGTGTKLVRFNDNTMVDDSFSIEELLDD